MLSRTRLRPERLELARETPEENRQILGGRRGARIEKGSQESGREPVSGRPGVGGSWVVLVVVFVNGGSVRWVTYWGAAAGTPLDFSVARTADGRMRNAPETAGDQPTGVTLCLAHWKRGRKGGKDSAKRDYQRGMTYCGRGKGGRDDSNSLTRRVSGPRGALMQAVQARASARAVQPPIRLVANHAAQNVQESPDWGGRPFGPVA